ncbi:MAG: SDR family NAD(P)-dependent oxidoreductase [Comamonadaceae bacterium]|nr:SDR family NAD(P)-dependent oxidoreductase [Comamonadaceae bacterium]
MLNHFEVCRDALGVPRDRPRPARSRDATAPRRGRPRVRACREERRREPGRVRADLAGKTCLVTGASGGIGLAAARGLARLGARVVMAVRDPEKGERARRAVMGATGAGEVELAVVDLARRDVDPRVRARPRAPRHPKLDVLVNNAGSGSERRRRSAGRDRARLGHERPRLLPRDASCCCRSLEAAGKARVVNVASQLAGGLGPRRRAVRAARLERARRLRPEQAGRPHAHLGPRPPAAGARASPRTRCTPASWPPRSSARAAGWSSLVRLPRTRSCARGGPRRAPTPSSGSPRARTSRAAAASSGRTARSGAAASGDEPAAGGPGALSRVAPGRVHEAVASLIGPQTAPDRMALNCPTCRLAAVQGGPRPDVDVSARPRRTSTRPPRRCAEAARLGAEVVCLPGDVPHALLLPAGGPRALRPRGDRSRARAPSALCRAAREARGRGRRPASSSAAPPGVYHNSAVDPRRGRRRGRASTARCTSRTTRSSTRSSTSRRATSASSAFDAAAGPDRHAHLLGPVVPGGRAPHRAARAPRSSSTRPRSAGTRARRPSTAPPSARRLADDPARRTRSPTASTWRR